MGNPVTEFRGDFHDVLAITELRGSYPNVPIAADVDYAALIAGDDSPVFLTLPIGKAGSTSGNRRHYDDDFVQELERQTLANKPIGLMGHLTEQERATAFPAEAVHWVGAMRDGDTLWGKAYVVPGAVRDRIQRYKAQGKAIATSIDAFAEGQWDESLKAHRMKAASLRLNQIDIAPADRAGIPALAAVPFLTTEMEDPADPAAEEETPVDKLQIIHEMTADDARLLPDPVRQAILATVQPPPEVAVVQELRSTLGLDDQTDLVQAITGLQDAVADANRTAVATRLTELLNDPEKGIKVAAVKGLVTELVQARDPQTPADVEAAYTQVVEMQSIKDTLAATVQATMGPPQGTPVAPQTGKTGKYVIYPQEA